MIETSPWLVVGLGNPGLKYARNRHNIGFSVVDQLLEALSEVGVPTPSFKERFKGHFSGLREAPGKKSFGRCFFLKPQTYMNCSGDSVKMAAAFHQIEKERLIVVHDEIDFPLGRVAIKKGGGHGGHNGLRDIGNKLGSLDFIRIRMGVGRPVHGEVSSWVLADFPKQELPWVTEMVEKARSATQCVMAEGIASAMNKFNTAAG